MTLLFSENRDVLQARLQKLVDAQIERKQAIGHSGISGAFAFYSPSTNVYLAGTLNQLDDQTLPYKFMLKVISAAKTK